MDEYLHVGEAIEHLDYSAYKFNRDRRPDIPAGDWAMLFVNAEALEARYQEEKSHDGKA